MSLNRKNELKNHEIEKIAEEAVANTRDLITKSSTAPGPMDYKLAESIWMSRRQVINHDKALQDLFRIPDPSTDHFLYDIKRLMKQLKASHQENCYGYAMAVMNFCRKHDVPAELIAVNNGDHVFVVMCRDRSSDLNNPKQWGTKAYICDAWAENKEQQVYQAKYFYDNLKCHKVEDEKNIVYDFDHSIHDLEILGSTGGNDEKRKNASKEIAISKLILLQNVIKKLAEENNKDYTKDILFLKITKTIKILAAKDPDNFHSTAKFERYLAKMTRSYIKKMFDAYGEQSKKAIFDAWINDYLPQLIANKNKKQLYSICRHILLSHDNQIALALIQTLSKKTFNEMLLHFKNDITRENLLEFAIRYRDVEFVNAVFNKTEPTLLKISPNALIYAAEKGYLDIVNAMLMHHVNVDTQLDDGSTALLYAIDEGHIAIVEKLLAAGADPELPNQQGVTPLACATAKGNPRMIEIIKKSLADKEQATQQRYAFFQREDDTRFKELLLFLETLKSTGFYLEEITNAIRTATESKTSVKERLSYLEIEIASLSDHASSDLQKAKSQSHYLPAFQRLENFLSRLKDKLDECKVSTPTEERNNRKSY